jgi:hypothetical protein
MQVFFELGLSMVLMQFISHEFAFLNFSADGNSVVGDEKHKSRMASVLKLSFKWYSVSAVLLFLLITPVGFIFFSQKDEVYGLVNWKLPWVVTMVATAINLFCSPFLSIIEGMGRILEVAKFRFFQMFIGYGSLIISLNLSWGLYSLAILLLINAATSACWLIGKESNWKVFIDIWNSFKLENQISWRNDIFPFQWKIALSWLSGYFIFHLLNPILFAYKGAVVAGQMGMTLTVFGGLSAISMAWINTKIPMFSMLIAKREYSHLDQIFFKTLKQSLLIATAISVVGWTALNILHVYLPRYGSRFLEPGPMIFVAINSILNQLIFALAVYLRSHKKEPFLIPSIVGAITTVIIAFVCAKWFNVFELTLSFLVVGLVLFLPWNIRIFLSKRLEWHR